MKKKYIAPKIKMSGSKSPEEEICYEVVSGNLDFSDDYSEDEEQGL